MQPGWCQPVRQEFMENECEALPGVAYPGVRDNRSTINTKTAYDDDDDDDTVSYQIHTSTAASVFLLPATRSVVEIRSVATGGISVLYTPQISNRFVHVWDINKCFEIAMTS